LMRDGVHAGTSIPENRPGAKLLTAGRKWLA
jgi:hypothetical protein